MARRRYKLLKQPADVDNMEGFDLTGIADGDLLQYDLAAEVFYPVPLSSFTFTASQISDFTEASQDATASLIQNGTGISWSYNDVGNTLTPTVSLAPFSTTNLAEGTNLYYTAARFNTAFAAKTTSDLTEGSNLYFTDERAQDAVGAALTDSATVDFTYTDGSNAITAAVIQAGLDHGSIGGLSDNDHPQYPLSAGTETISGAWTFSVAPIFTAANGAVILANTAGPLIRLTDTDAAADQKNIRIRNISGNLSITSETDLEVSTTVLLATTRSGTAWATLTFGNSTDNPSYSFAGTGTVTAARVVVNSGSAGTNSLYLPAANTVGISTASTLAMSWDSSQNCLGKAAIRSDSATAGVGYATGAGGTVTQGTNRTTGVTLNKVCGAITLVSAAGSATFASFTVTNSAVAATDVVKVCQKSGTDKYLIHVTAVAAGSFEITFATTGGTTTEQPVFNFTVIKAVTA